MLDPAWAWTPIILWVTLAAVLALFIVRTVLKDRREYQRFKRYRSTAKRQEMLRKWLVDSILTFGLVSVVLLVLVWQFVPRLLAELQQWFTIPDGILWGMLVGGVLVFIVLTVVGIISARREPDDIPTVGDVSAMLPRNRQELRFGWALSINAGISEELMFRLAIPAVVFGATGSAIAAVVLSVVLFGALHLYQGVMGVLASTLIGAFFFFTYVASGSILVPIVLHVLFDLRSLVLIPTTIYGAHRVDGRVQKYIPRARPVARVVTAEAAVSTAEQSSPSSPPQP